MLALKYLSLPPSLYTNFIFFFSPFLISLLHYIIINICSQYKVAQINYKLYFFINLI
nr:MAG TPA: hypothetical protein [Caudoviricetes sp.]